MSFLTLIEDNSAISGKEAATLKNYYINPIDKWMLLEAFKLFWIFEVINTRIVWIFDRIMLRYSIQEWIIFFYMNWQVKLINPLDISKLIISICKGFLMKIKIKPIRFYNSHKLYWFSDSNRKSKWIQIQMKSMGWLAFSWQI